MSAKLVVQKFASETDFQSIQVTINDDSNLAKYSTWTNMDLHKKKETQKNSKLIVKLVVSDNELCQLNLDSCAKEINPDCVDIDLDYLSHYLYENQNCDAKQEFTKFKIKINNLASIGVGVHTPNVRADVTQTSFQTLYEAKASNSHNNEDSISPLEYSLERVKENNARIMENIQMLNRTLSYTQKKEQDVRSMPSYPCTSCGKCFVYETGLKRHYAIRHAVSDMHPRWQVVWTCVECFQVWPKQGLALNHSVKCCKPGEMELIREMKTSSLLQCEFCEKVFTSIPRMLRHTKIHNTASNYECNACNMAFLSYKIAEQHWMLCPWMQISYNFSLPKHLLCNTCDRKFRNYDQLYNHRYKVGHFMTKTHCNQISSRSLGLLVYQCELCGNWFLSIEQLHAHRKQYHPQYDVGRSGVVQQADYDYNG